MNYPLWKKVLGVLFILLGALALVTPLTPGSWLVFVGAEMLGIGILSRGNIIRLYEKFKTQLRGWFGKKEDHVVETEEVRKD